MRAKFVCKDAMPGWFPPWLAIILGAGLIVVALLDLFWTVLYARSGKGIITPPLNAWTWWAIRRIARIAGKHKEALLGYFGPVILIVTAGMWVALLALGFGLIFWPCMATGIQATTGPTPTGFIVAMTYAGDCLTTVGSGELTPRTNILRLLVMVASIIGMSTITLTLTYFLQVYNALLRRNTFALRLHHATGNTGDAAELLTGLISGGDSGEARAGLVNFSLELINLYESQHFYPNLIYFRFREPYYALSRVVQVTMDTVSLLRSAVDEKLAGPLNESAAVKQFWGGGKHLLVEISATFLPVKHRPEDPNDLPLPDEPTARRWRRRYFGAVERLRAAGIPVTPDPEKGANAYIELRRQWDAYMLAFARFMSDEVNQIDPPGYGDESHDPAPDPAGLNDRKFKAAG